MILKLSPNPQESETNTINITEYSPDLIDALIHYIYSGGKHPSGQSSSVEGY